MHSNRLRNVIFDFGGVLINWRPQDVVIEMFNDPVERNAVMRGVFMHPDWLELDRGALDESEAVARFAARSGVGRERIRELMDRVLDSLALNPDTALLVESLAEQGVPVYGMSNMSAATFDILRRRHEIWPVFNGIVISGEIGMVKPERGIFDHIVSEYGLKPSETVLVDDHAANILAADDLGFQTILFRDCAECEQELRKRLGLRSD